MKNIYFTPGPSELYPTYPLYLKTAVAENIGSISHRSDEFMQLFSETRENLSNLMGIPKTHRIYFLSSATECMERIIQSTVYSHTLHLINGAFSRLFFTSAVNQKKNAEFIEVPAGWGFDFQEISVPKSTELVCFTHNETSTGVSTDLKEIKQHFKKRNDILFALDIVSSAPYVNADFTLFDLVFFSVQKGFGLPSGLGILIVSPKAYKKATEVLKDDSQRSYHDIRNLEKYALQNQTPETPNVMGIYLFNKVIQDMADYGIEKIRKDTRLKAEILYDCFDKTDCLDGFVEKKYRSKTVCVANTKSGSGRIITSLKKNGLHVGSGYKDMKPVQIRIANFPAHSIRDIETLAETLNMVCKRLK